MRRRGMLGCRAQFAEVKRVKVRLGRPRHEEAAAGCRQGDEVGAGPAAGEMRSC